MKLPKEGRKKTFKELDKQLAIWVRERQSKKLRTSHTFLQQKAMHMFNAEQDEAEFKWRGEWQRQLDWRASGLNPSYMLEIH
uniref:Uncharacterized protein n=1 Tax=Ditylenchus dipsaci TaxID=166011 RepID=A0A915CWW4_9BILA